MPGSEQLPISETNLNSANQTANELAEKANALADEHFHEPYADSLTEAVNELIEPGKNRFSRAQTRLEAPNTWTDETRWLATEINQAEQDLVQNPPLSFEDAKSKVAEWANSDLKNDDRDTRRSGRELEDALRLLSRPSRLDQIEALDVMLQDTELTLAGYAKTRAPGVEAEIREYRAIRDALFKEKARKQAEQSKSGRRATVQEPNNVVDEDAARRTDEARKVVADAQEQGEAELDSQVPDDEAGLRKFAKKFEDLDPAKGDLFNAYVKKLVQSIASQVPEGARYPDTVVTVFGNGSKPDIGFLYETVSEKLGRRLDPNDFGRLRFSEVANLLGLNVEQLIPDYKQRFNTERGLSIPKDQTI